MTKPLNPTTFAIPVIGRAATVAEGSVNTEARTVEIVWTTGATVQRVRWEGWDERVEYDEELIVNDNSVRLERMNNGAPFLDSHSSWSLSSVMGSVVPGSVRIEGGKGYATIKLSSAPDVADAVHKIMEGTIRSVSVGYRVHEYKITKRDGQRELWQAVDWEPMEVSAVAMPADAGAVIRSSKDGAEPALHPCLITRQDQTAAILANKRGNQMAEDTLPGGDQTRAVVTPPAPVITPAAPTADAIRAEIMATTTTVLDLCARHGLDAKFGTDMIGRGVTLDAIRVAVLDKIAERDAAGGRTHEPTFAQVRGEAANDVAFRDGMELAIMHRANPGGVTLTEPARQFRGMTLIEMAREALQRANVNVRGMSKLELAGAALGIQSGMQQRSNTGYHGGSDFPFILANVANKSLRAAYDGTPRTFTAWAKQATIPDFKQVARNQLGGAPDLLRVPESGEFTYGTIGEGREVYSLITYGRIIGINRQSLINDDLEAFTRIPTAFGASAADLESDLVYSILLANANMGDGSPLFGAAHANAGTAGAISETSLAEAYRLFGNQRGLEGRVISIQPRYLITPPGTRFIEARKNITATTPANVAGVNAFAGMLELIMEPRLIGTPDPWFLAADPQRVDTVEYAYLEGSNGVYTETRTGFEVDGIEIKARHDFAAKALDWRGLFRNVGV